MIGISNEHLHTVPVSTTSAAEHSRYAFPADDIAAFGAYHDLYDCGTTVSRTEGPFGAAISAYRFPRILAFKRKVAGAAHHRSTDRVRRDGFDHINLQILRSGSMAAGEPGHEHTMSPGDTVVFDTTRPQRTFVADADYLSVAINRDAITAILPDVRSLHGCLLSKQAAGLLADFLLSFGRHIASMTPALASESAGFMGALLHGAVDGGASPSARRNEAAATSELHRWRAEAYIDSHLHDRALDVDAVAAGIGVARTTLYAAFASKGGVARQILDRRVKRLSEALLRPAETRSVSALAYDLGFADESHCSRAFKASFGCPPGQFRAMNRSGRASLRQVPFADGWADWWDAIA